MSLNQTVVELLRGFFRDQPVSRAYVFGSFARGDADEKSDIDIMVELDHSQPVGLKFFRMHNELEALLRAKVDLVSADGISKYIRPYVEGEMMPFSRSNNMYVARRSTTLRRTRCCVTLV